MIFSEYENIPTFFRLPLDIILLLLQKRHFRNFEKIRIFIYLKKLSSYARNVRKKNENPNRLENPDRLDSRAITREKKF